MPRGPCPNSKLLAAESLPQVTVEHINPCLEDPVEVTDNDSSSSSSAQSHDSDADNDLISEADKIDGIEEPPAEDEQSVAGSRRKRRRVTRAKERCCSGHLHLSAGLQTIAVPEVTLIIFDWDDTLFPSTWLQQQGLQIIEGSASPSEEQRKVCKMVARCVIRTLRKAKQLGRAMIVTNAEKGWVELSCSKFLPEVFPLLEGMKVLSARSMFEDTQPESPFDWKRLAFQKEIDSFMQSNSHVTEAKIQKNMISVGDSLQERRALLQATHGRDCWTKSLKLEDRPTPLQLLKQHRLLRACLRPFVDSEGSLDLCLQAP